MLLIELGLGDWRTFQQATGASVIAFARHADCKAVAACFDAGANDVVTRSDRTHEVIARIRALARRRPDLLPRPEVLRVGDVELDPERRLVAVRRKPAPLTRKQFDLLEFFLENAGRVVTRGSLLDNVWGADNVDPNAVELQVRRLREAIEDDPRHPARLRTVRGVGYLYEREGR